MKQILFNTDMVRAILDGRKNVTRRVVKPGYRADECGFQIVTRRDGTFVNVEITDENEFPTRVLKPPCDVDDILYVRETWGVFENLWSGMDTVTYKANYVTGKDLSIKWRPSIHMPKEAARIFLRVTAVHVERLQNMTVDDCLNEGASADPPPICQREISYPNSFPKGFDRMTKEKQDDWIATTARARHIGWLDYADKLFRAMSLIWDSTIKPADLDRYGWSANPWVWVIEFERISKEEAMK